MGRLCSVLLAWAVGWLVYMIAVVVTGVYDGILSLIFQPICALFVSAGFVAFSILVGLIFLIPAIGNFWRSTGLIAIALAFACILLMLFGSSLGFTEVVTDRETGRQIVGLQPSVGFTCYFLLIFAIANFPVRKKNTP